MGCIYAGVKKAGGCISAEARRTGGIIAICSKADGGISADALRLGGINVRLSLICAAKLPPFLEVAPTEVQWVTMEDYATYYVHSNTNWNLT